MVGARDARLAEEGVVAGPIRDIYRTLELNGILRKFTSCCLEKSPVRSLARKSSVTEAPLTKHPQKSKNGVFVCVPTQNSSRLRPFVTFECSILVYYFRSFDPCRCATYHSVVQEVIVGTIRKHR